MLTIYVSAREREIITVDGCHMAVKDMFVREGDGYVSLQDFKPPSDLDDLKLVLLRRFSTLEICLPADVKKAMLGFLQTYHAKQDVSFDCYAFVNLVKGVADHRVLHMPSYWSIYRLPWRPDVGSVVFLVNRERQFYHAAIYTGFGLYISVWGAGGDLEIATLKPMKRDFGAKRAVLAIPRRQ